MTMKKSLHKKASVFISKGLFDQISEFRELESRISLLPTEQERGDAFEVFAEAFLNTQPIAQAHQVWPHDAIPTILKERFALVANRDMGVDGIFKTLSDEYHAYQAKFRNGRTPLKWSELATFMGLTDQISQRLLFTNCDNFPPLMKERLGFYAIRGNDLDCLEPQCFNKIEGWLKRSQLKFKNKEPKAHQTKAIEAVISTLGQHDRATMVMPCGTGKTLVALWIAERMQCRNIIALFPTLSLIKQTLHEWLKESRFTKLSYICVCSDPTVKSENDSIVIRKSDLNFPVSTDSSNVKRFIDHKFNGTKIIFSTYQSSHIVAGGMNRSNPFDFGIFDEAHKTAGRVGSNYNFALDNKNIPITKRIFMTATPRHFDVRRKDIQGDDKLVYSMDVPEVYGPIAYSLSFFKAAEQDIICNYKVIISAITSSEVDNYLLQKGKVLVKSDQFKARYVANQIALKKALRKKNAKKLFTFHNSVASARAFVAEGSGGISTHIPDIKTFHVNGNMSAGLRENILNTFRNEDKALISNARCLIEGVDVPSVDLVGFLSPKKSKIDIVQSIGRALRKEKEKTFGFIFLPLYVEQEAGESIEEALTRAEFDEIWNVLQAMQEHDEVLAEIIKEMREQKGLTGGYDDSRIREKIEILGPFLMLDTLKQSIITLCIEKLGRIWDERYGELKAYKNKIGHCRVPKNYAVNRQLAKWVEHQRNFRRQRLLNEERIRRLDEIGFLWNPDDESWEEYFNELLKFKTKYGHAIVEKDWSENPKLGRWVNKQRSKRDQLDVDKVRRLDGIGFCWGVRELTWEKRFNELLEYKKVHGDCNVPHLDRNAKDRRYKVLGTWVANVRQKKDELDKDRIKRLDEIDFKWQLIIKK
jgi:predicted helicase